MGENDLVISEFIHALLRLDQMGAKSVLLKDRGAVTVKRIDDVLVPALEKLGERWESGELALSQIYMAGRICEEIMEAQLPRGGSSLRDAGIGIAVLEDYHLLGRRLVSSVLVAAGYRVSDLGYGMDAGTLAQRAKASGIKILLVSTLMMRAALSIKELTRILRADGSDIKVVAGGAPFRFDPELWREVGADAAGAVASDAIRIVNELAGVAGK